MHMDALKQFSIPIKGLKGGISAYDFLIDSKFFECFEDSLIEEGKIHLNFTIEKRPDFFELLFDFKGTIKAACDRCLTEIDLPISGEERLLLKYSYEEVDEEPEVIYVLPDAPQLNIAKYVYEFITLAIPIVKVFDCQAEKPYPCDQEMLKYLEVKSDDYNSEQKNPAWDELKKLNL